MDRVWQRVGREWAVDGQRMGREWAERDSYRAQLQSYRATELCSYRATELQSYRAIEL